MEEEPSDDDEEEVPITDGQDCQNERIVVDGICNPEDASSMSDDSCDGNINEGIGNGDNDDEYDGPGVKVLYNMRDGNVVPQLM